MTTSTINSIYSKGRGQRLRLRTKVAWRRFKNDWQVFSQNRLAVLGLGLILLFGIMAIIHPLLMATVWGKQTYDPITGYDFEIMIHPSPPSWIPRPDDPMYAFSFRHILGTDGLGHDVLSMLLAATTPAFTVGIAAALTTAAIGLLIGVVSAYYGGIVDTLLMHVADAFLLLPAPLFMVIAGMRFDDLGPASLGLIYGLIAGTGGAAIVMRSHALSIVARPFIEAARTAGGNGRHIIAVHILPHVLPLATLYMMLAVTGAIVADAFIAFFGFSRNYMSWGTIVYSSFVYSAALGTGTEWHVLIPPCMALSLFAAAFYLVSRGLHQVADPRLRER